MGGGIYTYDPQASFEGCNNIIVGNYCDGSPNWFGNVYLDYSCSPEMINGTGNITGDPMFMAPNMNDFNLQSYSPCIDAGDPLSPLDPDSTIADMGAYYYDQGLGVGPIAENLPLEYSISAYPNPFNSSITINYQLIAFSHVTLLVYDIQGREIIELLDGYQRAGNHEIIFDAKDLVSGVYFLMMEAENFNQTRKLLLIK